MAVVNYKLRLNGGAFTNVVFDAGVPDPLEHLYTGLAADTDYTVEIKAVDAWGNESAWSDPFLYTTPAASLPWTNHVADHWTLDGSYNLNADADTFAPYAPEVVPRFNNVGDYIEFTSISGVAFFKVFIMDGSGHLLKTNSAGQIDDEGGFFSGADPYDDGDVVRWEKTSATRFSYSVNGGTPVEAAKDFTGEVTAHVETVTLNGHSIAAPVTNIPF